MVRLNTKNYNAINEVLMEWNPIEVNESSLKDEYSDYIPGIMKIKTNFADLVVHLEYILINDIGLNYQSDNIEHKKDLLLYAYKIFLIE